MERWEVEDRIQEALAETNGSVALSLRSGSGILKTLTLSVIMTLDISCGVIKIYCFLSDILAVSIIIFIEIRRLTASMNTSNSSTKRRNGQQKKLRLNDGRNTPRQRTGQPIHSQRERSKQMVENDFSPPLRDFGSLSPEPWVCV